MRHKRKTAEKVAGRKSVPSSPPSKIPPLPPLQRLPGFLNEPSGIPAILFKLARRLHFKPGHFADNRGDMGRMGLRICGICFVILPHDDRNQACPGARVEKIRRELAVAEKDILVSSDKLRDRLRFWVRVRDCAIRRVNRRGQPFSPAEAVCGTACPDCRGRKWELDGSEWRCIAPVSCAPCRGTGRRGETKEERVALILSGEAVCASCGGSGGVPCWATKLRMVASSAMRWGQG